MASIQPVTLTITPVPNSSNVSVYVGYVVVGNSSDLTSEQRYREVCELIGDDTPGDGTDDVIRTLFDATTAFTDHQAFTRAIQLFMPLSELNEDSGRPIFDDDEIRARVTLTPIPASRESNLIRIGGPVITQG